MQDGVLTVSGSSSVSETGGEGGRGREGGREGGIVHVHMGKQNICGATLLYTAAV